VSQTDDAQGYSRKDDNLHVIPGDPTRPHHDPDWRPGDPVPTPVDNPLPPELPPWRPEPEGPSALATPT
jgi:hypothetical protein